MAARYKITVRYLPRSLLLDGALPVVYVARGASKIWTFEAVGPKPPRRRASVWRVRYQPAEGPPVAVLLDMRFVTMVEEVVASAANPERGGRASR